MSRAPRRLVRRAPRSKTSGHRPMVTVYVIAVTAAALVAIGATIATSGWPEHIKWVSVGTFFVLLAAAEYLIVRFEYRGETIALSLFEAVLAPAIAVLSPPTVVLTVVAAQVAAGAGHRVRPLKTLFNTAQWALAAAAGVAAYNAVGERDFAFAHTLIAVLVALAVMAVVNMVLVTGVMRLTQDESMSLILARVAPPVLLGWLINSSVGSLFVLATSRSPASVALFLVPLIALHSSYRGHATAVADRRRLARLHHALQMFSAPIDPQVAIERLLSEVRDCFDADTVELILPCDDGRLVHRMGRDAVHRRILEEAEAPSLAAALLARGGPLRVTSSSGDIELAPMMRRDGWRDCIAAPVITDGVVKGMVAAYDSSGLEGFEESEIAVLHALAGEAAAMIERGALLEQVLEERRRFSEIVTSTSDGIMTVGSDGTIHTWNPASEQITGYPAEGMVGSQQLGILRPRGADGHDVLLERWAEDGVELPRDIQIVDRGGALRWLSCTYTRVADGDGQARTLIVVARDVTKVREVEQLKDDFVATVSHELRTPLTPIRGWATTLLERGEQLRPHERRIAAEAIGRQAAHLERLITDLLQASQIEPSQGLERNARIDAASVAGKVVDEFMLSNPRRSIVLNVDEHPLIALGNDLWIERILSNLVSNALKYAPGPEPIDVSVRGDRKAVTITVSDQGPGIDPRDHDAIFERFRRLGDHATRAQGGAGLGLYIARRLATSIGGSLAVDSSPGTGATFTLSLRGADRLALVG